MTALLSRVDAEPAPTPERFAHLINLPCRQPCGNRVALGISARCEQAR